MTITGVTENGEREAANFASSRFDDRSGVYLIEEHPNGTWPAFDRDYVLIGAVGMEQDA